jgi:hypothetical protein
MPALQFCNVDLDIESESDLAVLKSELGRHVVALPGGPVNSGSFLLRLETAAQFDDPDDTICGFCSLLEQLSVKGKRSWRSAYKKEFDIGYELIQAQYVSKFSLRAETLKRISALGATLGVTIYDRSRDQQKQRVKLSSPRGKRK